MEFLDTVRNRKDDPERELRPRAAGALHARRQGPRAARSPTTRRTTSCRSRAPSPAGATTTAAATRSSTTASTTSTPTSRRARPEGDLQDHRRLRRRRAATSTDQRRGRAGDRHRHRHHLRAHATRRARTRSRAAPRTGCSSTSRIRQPVAHGVHRRGRRRLRLRHAAGTSQALLRAIFVPRRLLPDRGRRPRTAPARSRSSGRSTTSSARSGCSA